jgi:hypothetical protein
MQAAAPRSIVAWWKWRESEIDEAGQYIYSREIPANLLTGDVARVDFSLDKTIPPTAADRRELGVVVSVVGFQPR